MLLQPESRAMLDEEFAAIIGAADDQLATNQLAKAQACLDLYEKDRGRRATSALEIRNWADVQDPANLRFRILRRLRADQAWAKACKWIWTDIPAPLAARPPMGQRITLTLAEAAKATGLSETALRTAIEAGWLAGMKDMDERWHVDRTALCRAFPSARAAAAQSDCGNGRPLDAATLVLEVGLSSLVRQAGDTLRHRRIWWRRGAG
jgi:hypothetical protein